LDFIVWDCSKGITVLVKSAGLLRVCDAGIGYPALALGHQAGAGDAAGAVGAKEPTFEAVLPAVSPRLQSNNEGVVNVFNLHYITYL